MIAKEPTKKRAYSRNGCTPCKQRKAKCDETRPQCMNCINTNRECSYRKILKFTDRRSFTVKGSSLSNIKNVNRPSSSLLSKRGTKSITISELNRTLAAVNETQDQKDASVTKKQKLGNDPFLENIPQVVQNNFSSGSLYPSALNEPLGTFPSTTSNDAATNSGKADDPDLKETAKVSSSSMIPNDSTSLPALPQVPSAIPLQTTQLDLENSLFDGATTLITDLNELFGSLDMFNPANFTLPPIATEITHAQTHTQSLSNQIESPEFGSKLDSISPTQYSVDSPKSFVNISEIASTDTKRITDRTRRTSSTSTDAPTVKKNISVTKNDKGTDYAEEEDYDEYEENEEEEEEEDDDDEEEEDSNQVYIQTLTRSLQDYRSPIPLPTIQSPTTPDGQYKVSSSNFLNSKSNIDGNPLPLDAFPPPSLDTIFPFDYIEMINRTISDEDIESLAYFFNWSVSSAHIRYLKIFVTNIHLNILPFSTNYTNNAYTRIFLQQAKNSPHLLFAILAISARFEVYQIEQNPNIPGYEDKLNYHNKYRSYYLSSCLKALESVLHSKQTTLNNIETLLLTIQVLASDFSGHKGSQWRTHLHGAKDLLIEYCRYRPLSLELTIVWVWFYSMEVLAALTAPKGGTIHNFEEMYEFLPVLCPRETELFKNLQVNKSVRGEASQNSLLEPGKLTNALKFLGVAVEGKLKDGAVSNFNMYLGYDDTMIEVFNTLVIAIECVKSRTDISYAKISQKNCKLAKLYESKILDRQGKTLNSDFFLSLMALIKKARTFTYLDNSAPYIVPLGQKNHPSEILERVEGAIENTASSSKAESAEKVLESVLISAYIHPNQSSSNSLDGGISENSAHSSPYRNTISSRNNSRSPAASPENNGETKFTSEQTKGNVRQSNLNISDAQISMVKSDIYFSWVDLAQQLNADAAFLRLLTLKGGICTTGMNIQSNMVQDIIHRMIMGLYGLVRFRADIAEDIDDNSKLKELNERYLILEYSSDTSGSDTSSDESGVAQLKTVKELANWSNFEFDKYLDYQFDNRLVMVQWPLYVCGLCCIEPKHKAIIECCFTGLIGLGVGSGELSVKKLRKIWTLQKIGKFDFENFNLFGQGFDDDEEDDYVPFM